MAMDRTFGLALLALCTTGCSSVYEVTASMRDGKVVFVVSSGPPQSPLCLRKIEVVPVGERLPVWMENISYQDPCLNRFPVTYGERFKGRQQIEGSAIAARPLRSGMTYEVRTTTGANGYGSGRFVVLKDGTVRNLK